MKIALFPALNASNTPLILFNQITDWLHRHDSVITQHGTHCLTKRKMFPQDLNAKLYAK